MPSYHRTISGSTETYLPTKHFKSKKKKRLQKIKLKITAEAYQQGKDDFLNHWFQATLRGITKAIKFWKKISHRSLEATIKTQEL